MATDRPEVKSRWKAPWLFCFRFDLNLAYVKAKRDASRSWSKHFLFFVREKVYRFDEIDIKIIGDVILFLLCTRKVCVFDEIDIKFNDFF